MTDPDDAVRLLRWAAVVFVLGSASHNVDHWRLGIENTPSAVIRVGYVGIALSVLAVVLSLLGSRYAPPLAVGSGFATALGFASVHLPPEWGPLSMPFRAGTDAASWTTASAAILAGTVFGAAGLVALRARSHVVRVPAGDRL